jgi:hypothetical protein
MTEAQAAARGIRARDYRDEFLGPILDDMRAAYANRIVEIASKEHDPKARADKLTSLSVALRILENIAGGIDAAIMDGEIAEKNMLKVEHIEKMSAPQRRIFNIAPRY